MRAITILALTLGVGVVNANSLIEAVQCKDRESCECVEEFDELLVPDTPDNICDDVTQWIETKKFHARMECAKREAAAAEICYVGETADLAPIEKKSAETVYNILADLFCNGIGSSVEDPALGQKCEQDCKAAIAKEVAKVNVSKKCSGSSTSVGSVSRLSLLPLSAGVASLMWQ